MSIACLYCIASKGIRGSGENLVDGKQAIFDKDEDYYNHLEMEHDLVIRREYETADEATKRVYAKNSRIGTENCQCPSCKNNRGDSRDALADAIRKGESIDDLIIEYSSKSF